MSIKEKILVLQIAWIEMADRKVAPLFAINTAMLGLLIVFAHSQYWSITLIVLSIIAIFLLLTSLFCLAFVMFPRIEGVDESNVFFGGIAKQVKGNYVSRMLLIKDDSEHQEDILNQIYCTAKIAEAKYRWMKNASTCTFASTPFWLVSFYILYV